MLALGPAEFEIAQLRRNQGRDAKSDPVLQVEQIDHISIETVRPNDAPCLRLAQLDRDPPSVTRAANAAVQDVPHIEVVSNTAYIKRRARKAAGRTARDHQQILKPAQSADDVVDHSFS